MATVNQTTALEVTAPLHAVQGKRSFPKNTRRSDSELWPLLLVTGFACLVNWPCLLWGLQFGHDHNLHLTYLHYFEQQLRAGELYPRWIGGLNFGAGSPIFFVQYPLPFYVAAAFQWVFHLPATANGTAHALGLFVFFTGILSGVFSWLWCRALTNPVVAAICAVAYLTMPYVYDCDAYYRAAIGEYSALAWAPLALFFAHQIDANPRRSIAGIAISVAPIVLSNLFTALLFTPLLILYAVFQTSRAKRLRAALFAICAIALGLGLSAVYLLPMNTNRTFFSVANLLQLGPKIFYYRDNLFPFGTSLFPTGSFSLQAANWIGGALGLAAAVALIIRLRKGIASKLLAGAAIILILATCAAPLFHLVGFVPHPELANLRVVDVRSRIFVITFLTLDVALLSYATLRTHCKTLPSFLITACLGCYFLSTRWSEWIWAHASFMWNIQFPWRLGGILSLFSLGLVALRLKEIWDLPLRRRRQALIVGAALWLVVAGTSFVVLGIGKSLAQPFFTEIKQKIETPFPAYARISKLPSPDELGPNDDLTNKVPFRSGEGTATLDTIDARHLRLRAACMTGCRLLLRLVYYPLWKAREGAFGTIALLPSERAGLTELQLGPGSHVVDLELPRGGSEIWGTRLSLVSVFLVALLFAGRLRTRTPLPQSLDDNFQ